MLDIGINLKGKPFQPDDFEAALLTEVREKTAA